MSELQQTLYLIADEMRGMASLGKYFAGNVYEVERAHRIMELAAKIAALAEGQPAEVVRAVFEAEPWLRASPAIGVEAVVLNVRREILLIRRRDTGLWALPGGLAEIGVDFSQAVLRELWEEAGLRGEVRRLLGVFDGPQWGSRAKVHMALLIYLVTCDDLTPHPGVEALDAGFFAGDRLPPLHYGHTMRVPKCFELLDREAAFFDPASSLHADMPMFQRGGDECESTAHAIR
ncbi:MAG: NUDIX hydrolase N-terminal domain-containing protein [Anaerolineae bacterium]|nr:NUDIX hydrolase N-terminal domain-containing protein [Anaerolineae bacterium]